MINDPQKKEPSPFERTGENVNFPDTGKQQTGSETALSSDIDVDAFLQTLHYT